MTNHIDTIDKKIVDLLMSDGRMSCADIARAVGNISERSIRYRLDKLLEEKVICISAIVDPKRLGYTVVADVFIEVEPGLVMSVAHQIVEFENVSYVACATGENDISVQIIAHDNAELYRFVTEVLGKIPGVRKTTTSIVPIILKDVYRWRIPGCDLDDTPEPQK